MSLYGALPTATLPTGETVNAVQIRNPNPPKTAYLRLPSNGAMMKYLSAQRSIYRDLGRGRGEGDPAPTPKADLELFAEMRLDQGEPFDEYEANNAIRKITGVRTLNSERDGDDYRITIQTPFGDVVHVVGSPTARDERDFRHNVCKVRDLPNNLEERRFPPEVSTQFYDAIAKTIEGYMDGIKPLDTPPNHKHAVAVAVIQQIDLLNSFEDPNF